MLPPHGAWVTEAVTIDAIEDRVGNFRRLGFSRGIFKELRFSKEQYGAL